MEAYASGGLTTAVDTGLDPTVSSLPISTSAPVTVAISSLIVVDSPRQCGEDPDHVKRLAEVYPTFPPIVVHRETMRVVDGIHRLRAAQANGANAIRVRFFEGAARDVYLFAVSENVSHGLPLSTADRKNAAERIMRSHPHISDRGIAAVVGLAHRTVSTLRPRPTGYVPQLDRRVGRDGRNRPVDATYGRNLAAGFIRDNPNASLREIARAASISPETARDVRKRLERGEDIGPNENQATRKVPDRCAVPVAPAQDPAAVLDSLRNDPSLRLNDAGKVLLRVLSSQVIEPKDWEGLWRHVPSHCRDRVAMLVRERAMSWNRFAALTEDHA